MAPNCRECVAKSLEGPLSGLGVRKEPLSSKQQEFIHCRVIVLHNFFTYHSLCPHSGPFLYSQNGKWDSRGLENSHLRKQFGINLLKVSIHTPRYIPRRNPGIHRVMYKDIHGTSAPNLVFPDKI